MKTIFMRKEDHEKWDRALRSGEYKQGFRLLSDSFGGYCCLGVLQMCLDGAVELTDEGTSKAYPSDLWKEFHDIKFLSSFGGGGMKSPSLGVATADWLNDFTELGFVGIADLIAEQVQYTDVQV